VGKQYGGASGWLGNLVKMAFPILLKKLFGIGKSVVSDVISKKKGFGESIKDHATEIVHGFTNNHDAPERPGQQGTSINRLKRKRKVKRLTASSFPLFLKRQKR
jgi:hypothetical protein